MLGTAAEQVLKEVPGALSGKSLQPYRMEPR